MAEKMSTGTERSQPLYEKGFKEFCTSRVDIREGSFARCSSVQGAMVNPAFEELVKLINGTEAVRGT